MNSLILLFSHPLAIFFPKTKTDLNIRYCFRHNLAFKMTKLSSTKKEDYLGLPK